MKITFKTILILLAGLMIGYPNYKLYYQPEFRKIGNSVYNHDVYQQLQFLKEKLRYGTADEMQAMFPEGYVFMNALYGLSWGSLIQKMEPDCLIYKEGLQEIAWAFREIDTPEAKAVFNASLPLEYGAFYKGWSNYLLGSKLQLQALADRDAAEVALFSKNCDLIAGAINQYENPFLESYTGQCWPADMLVGVASLKIHDSLFKNAGYDPLIKAWLIKVQARLDPATGLIPHSADYQTGEPHEGARGSSQSLMLNFLKEIDEDFARNQFRLYENLFLDRRLGLPGIREYPKGKKGKGDIDSGPVIWGIGGAASIVAQRTMAQYGQWRVYKELRNSIEAFGMGYKNSKHKKYLFGKLPMADAFIAWSNSAETRPPKILETGYWRLKFHLLSALVLLVLWLLVRK